MADAGDEGVVEALGADTAAGADPAGGVGPLPDLVRREPGVESLPPTGGIPHPAGAEEVDHDEVTDAVLEGCDEVDVHHGALPSRSEPTGAGSRPPRGLLYVPPLGSGAPFVHLRCATDR